MHSHFPFGKFFVRFVTDLLLHNNERNTAVALHEITIARPFNAHVHFRTGALLQVAAPFTASQFWGAIVMPNLLPPITTLQQLRSYRTEIDSCLDWSLFEPFLTLYLTETLEESVIEEAYLKQLASAVKYYPRGATTNSDAGIRQIEKIYPKLEVMESIGMPLLMHGEETVEDSGEEIDPYDREDIFLEKVYLPLRERFPALKISLEHISTISACEIAKASTSGQYQFTICPQHLLYDRRDVMRDGNQPDLTCMPRIKRKEHKHALRALISLGLSCVALGSDDAIHPESGKVRASGCNCGCFSSPYALELYAQVFDEMGALPMFENFASRNAPRFFGIENPHPSRLKLVREQWSPASVILIPGGGAVRPLGFREDPKKNIVLQWKMLE